MKRLDDYFATFVVRNFRAFIAAERSLVAAVKSGDSALLHDARAAALVAGMNAAVPAYHFADVAATDRPAWVPNSIGSGRDAVSRLRQHVEPMCRMLRSPYPIRDLTLLGDVVDAYKHAELRDRTRLVSSSKAAVVIGSGWGEMHYGKGNYGGLDQVIIETNNFTEKRALSAILQNVVDMWRTAMSHPLPPIGE
ncbi:MAG: hypothetical protein R3D68_04990 [Hyphomicrobiaceae bacterium]